MMKRSAWFLMSVICSLSTVATLTSPCLSAGLLGSIERLSAIGTPVPERRDAKHIPGEVIVRLVPGVVELPEGKVGGLDAISDESLR